MCAVKPQLRELRAPFHHINSSRTRLCQVDPRWPLIGILGILGLRLSEPQSLTQRLQAPPGSHLPSQQRLQLKPSQRSLLALAEEDGVVVP